MRPQAEPESHHVARYAISAVCAAVLFLLLTGCGLFHRGHTELAADDWHEDVLEFDRRAWSMRHDGVPIKHAQSRRAAHAQSAEFADRSVWTDPGGWMHLAMRRTGSRWLDSEVATPLPRSYMRVHFEMAASVPELDPNVAVGIHFTRAGRSDLDVAFQPWGPHKAQRGQFKVGRRASEGSEHRFHLPTGIRVFDVELHWLPNMVGFVVRSERGNVARWVYKGRDVPRPHGHRLQIRLGTTDGSAPASGEIPHIAVRNFSVQELQKVDPTPHWVAGSTISG